jgi:hypothetical protein
VWGIKHVSNPAKIYVKEGEYKETVSRDRFGFGGHAWSILGLNRGRGQFLSFLGAPIILKRKKCISRG